MIVVFDDEYLENLYEGKPVTGKPRFDASDMKMP